MKLSPKISLILEAFQNLEKVYVDLKKNLEIPKEEFINNKLVQDRVRIDFNLAFESSMRVCRHLSAVYGIKTSSKDCLYKIAQYVQMPFAEELKNLSEFYFKYRDLKEAVSPEELYDFLKKNLFLFKEYARFVVEHIKRTTGNYLLIDFDLLNEKAKFVKDSVKKIDFVLSQGFEEFKKTPMYYDRVKYFYQVAYDSLFEICRHLAPRFGIKKFGDDCLTKMVEKGIIPEDYYDTVLKMTLLKNKLISTWEVSNEELYNTLLELNPKFPEILKEISKSLRKLLEEKQKFKILSMQEKDCIFCKIIRGELPSKKVYEDDRVYAFHDINPVAPVHILIVPKKHIVGIQTLEPEDECLVGHMFYTARKIAEELELAPDENLNRGYRLVFNVGKDAGQSVFHLHLHLIGGRKMEWPPG